MTQVIINNAENAHHVLIHDVFTAKGSDVEVHDTKCSKKSGFVPFRFNLPLEIEDEESARQFVLSMRNVLLNGLPVKDGETGEERRMFFTGPLRAPLTLCPRVTHKLAKSISPSATTTTDPRRRILYSCDSKGLWERSFDDRPPLA